MASRPTASVTTRQPLPRHFGLDWLRVGAFAILILYHVGMVFVPWNFHVKIPGPWWVTVPMMASNPWRLTLLFIVSGYASRALLSRSPSPGRFALDRSYRLLVPLVFGVAIIVPPQPWVELMAKHGYAAGFGWFWTHDYFRFGELAGLGLPAWNHLWFIGYLWIYTLLLAVLLAISPASVRAGAQRAFGWVMRGAGLAVFPLGWLVLVNFVLFPGARETHALLDDWVAHATYAPAFMFGFAMAGAPRTLDGFVALWKPAAVVALLSYAVVAGIEIRWPGNRMPVAFWGPAFSIARAFEGWAAIVALIGFATSHWNRDHRWRAMLTEAVFPFYIIHQTVIVVVAWWLIGLGLSTWLDAVILVAATAGGCWAFYLAGRSIGPLRPLVGLRRHVSRRTHVDPRPAIA